MFLAIEHASVSYPGSGAAKAAVQDVSLVLRRGEIGVLIGPSGCGKTSLLRAVAGLERLATGRIVIDGVPYFTMAYLKGPPLDRWLKQQPEWWNDLYPPRS